MEPTTWALPIGVAVLTGVVVAKRLGTRSAPSAIHSRLPPRGPRTAEERRQQRLKPGATAHVPASLPMGLSVEFVRVAAGRYQLQGEKAIDAAPRRSLKRLSEQDAEHFCALWRCLAEGPAIPCHDPAFVVHLRGADVVYRMSLCWRCGNAVIRQGEMRQYLNFDSTCPAAQELLALLRARTPLFRRLR
jgi:hypothetical protein